MTLLDLYKILLEVDIPVGHYEIQQKDHPYIVYQELATTYKWASGQTVQENISVAVAHFTKNEFCPTLEKLKQLLLKNKIGFTIAHDYDPDDEDILNQFSLTISRDMEVTNEQNY